LSKENFKEKNYNEIYGQKGYKTRRGTLFWLYSRLKKYEESRTTVVYKMLSPGERFLDVGCGDGDFCIMTKSLFDHSYGLDISSIRISKAQNKVETREDGRDLTFIRHDSDENLPFPDEYFDTVTCIATLEYVLYPRKIIAEITRILKGGGFLVLQVSNIAFLPNRFASLIGKLPTAGGIDEIGVDWERLHSFNKKIMIKLVESNGLIMESVSCSGIFPNSRKIWISLLAGDLIVKAKKPMKKVER
jgi:ubiquinone/menaquinone biosynthesis C-methylase UbiE